MLQTILLASDFERESMLAHLIVVNRLWVNKITKNLNKNKFFSQMSYN